MAKYEKWDIYWAAVAYEDHPAEIKLRPVVITNSGDAYIIAFYTTSQSPKPGYDCYTIRYWQNAGLKRPSNVRLDKALHLRPSDMREYIGRLSEPDILCIHLALAQLAKR